jgi:hypothetical protein
MTATTIPHSSSERLIDGHAAAYDVTDSFVIMVDAEPETALETYDAAGAAERFAARVGALGPATGAALIASTPGRESVYGLTFSLGAGREVDVVWDVQARPAALDGSALATTVRFVARGEDARELLLSRWGAIGIVSSDTSRRSLRAIRERAEERRAAGRPAQAARGWVSSLRRARPSTAAARRMPRLAAA